MANQEVKFSNFYESTLANGGGGLPTNVIVATLTAAPTSNGTSAISTPYYLVVDPDSAGSREVIEVTAATGTSLTTIVRDKEGRYGTPGDASTAPNHSEGTVVRMAVVKEMFEDVHDRIDAGVTADGVITFTNKSISGSTNTLTNLPASEVDINGATDGTAITVDGENDLVLLYDSDATAVKKVKTKQIATPADVHPFLVMGA
jgi:hypothetical protein